MTTTSSSPPPPSGGASPLLEIRGLTVRFGQVTALEGLDVTVGRGEVVALLGTNGAGKTTTLRAISGLARPAAGEIVLDGRRITGSSPPAVARAGIGHVHEGRKIFPAHTVEENLALGAYLLRKDRRAAAESMDEMLTLFPRLAERRRQLAGTLSGGEAQMLAIARALVARPTLVMLDEPSLGLAPLVVEEIFEHLRNLRDHKHISMLLVEQAALLALEFAHRAYLLNTGRLGLSGEAKALVHDPQGAAVYLGGQAPGTPAGAAPVGQAGT